MRKQSAAVLQLVLTSIRVAGSRWLATEPMIVAATVITTIAPRHPAKTVMRLCLAESTEKTKKGLRSRCQRCGRGRF